MCVCVCVCVCTGVSVFVLVLVCVYLPVFVCCLYVNVLIDAKCEYGNIFLFNFFEKVSL